MDRLNVSQLVWFLNESFTKKTSGKSKDDIVKDTLNISVEEFQSRMKEFFDRKGYGKGLRYATGGIEVFFYPNIHDGIFRFCYYINYERENLSRVESRINLSTIEVKFLWKNKTELCMDLEVVVNNRIRFFSHKVDLNSFDDLEGSDLIKDGENLYSVKETELSLPLLIKMQQFLEKLVEKASKVHPYSLDVAFRNSLNDKEKIDVVKDFFF